MSGAFADALRDLRKHLGELPASPIEGLSLDDGSLVFRIVKAPINTLVRASLDIEAYPATGCLVSSSSADMEAQLAALSQSKFSDSTQLHLLVEKVLEVFGVSLSLSGANVSGASMPAKSGTIASAGRSSAGSDEMDDAMDEDGSDGDDGSYGGQASENDYNAASDGGEEDDGGSGGGGDESDEDERALMVEVLQKAHRWEKHEDTLKAAEAVAAAHEEVGDGREKKHVLSADEGMALKRNFFKPDEAFRMLSKELQAILREQSFEMFVDAVADDVYTWSVELCGFDPKSDLGKDMAEVQRRFAYSSVQLTIGFKRGLHPFYPPSVEIIRPHFKGPILGAIASHPMLLLDNWDPWRPQGELITQIKAFLQANARVDLEHPATDIRRYSSSYTPLERDLARLEALSGTSPLCLEAAQALYSARDSYGKDSARLGALASEAKKRKTEAASKSTAWAKGTGYGGSSDSKNAETWDAKASEAMQAARDQELQALLDQLQQAVLTELGPRSLEPVKESATGKSAKASAASRGSAEAKGATAHTSTPAGAAAVQQQPVTTNGGADVMEIDDPPGSPDVQQSEAPPPLLQSPLGPEGCIDSLAQSCLVPFMLRELHVTTFNDMSTRSAYYTAMLYLMLELCRPAPALQQLLCLTISSHCLTATISDLCSIAARFIKQVGPTDQESAAEAAAKEASTSASAASAPFAGTGTCLGAASKMQAAEADLERCLRLAHSIVDVHTAMQRLGIANKKPTPSAASSLAISAAAASSAGTSGSRSVAPASATPAGGALASAAASLGVRMTRSAAAAAARACISNGAASAAAAAAPAAAASTAAGSSGAAPSGSGGSSISSQAASAAYIQTLRPLQVDYVSGMTTGHHYASSASSEAVQPKPRTLRLAKEMASLAQMLPLDPSSSVFVRVDEGKSMIWRALIVGPEDTPYSGGCFLFDIYFPSNYPNCPPNVNLKTTGGGKIRFNPNLYNCGKVCLSLLGTWQGSKGEGWNADISTTLQVLISIQSLIFVPQPFFNEPGYEATYNTPAGQIQSRDYNKVIKLGTIKYAMVDMLKHPRPEFESVIKAHFKLRKDAVLATTQAWVDDAKAFDNAHATQLNAARNDLVTLLAAL